MKSVVTGCEQLTASGRQREREREMGGREGGRER